MAAIKTHNFLPEIFRTDANKKFLNATVDQLVNEPNFKRVSGYIGRKFAPTFKSTDSYVIENDADRQNYQLEPSVVITNPLTQEVESYSNYPDFINKIKFYGGNVDDHSRLFENEMYSYDGKFDFDKFVNFSQYYWLPNGPDSVLVSASGTPLEKTFYVKLNSETGSYYFTDTSKGTGNENIVLARGGTYTFNLDNVTDPFWIQSKMSATGQDPARTNISVRNVFGVTNNGASSGTITFTVPQETAQSFFTNMPIAASVDYATKLAYRDIHGKTVAEINETVGGLDGITGTLRGKTIVFVGTTNIDDYFWTNQDTTIVPESDRTRVWTITMVGDVITLVPSTTVQTNEQVYVKSGLENATLYFYLDYHTTYVQVPLLTAGLTSLYFQNENVATANGVITIVDPASVTIDPATDIVGKVSYTSPTGVIFSNGMKVEFDSSAVGEYANNTYYVEGVGKYIKLVPISNMIPVETWTNSTITFGGSGYMVNDLLTAVGGTGSSAQIVVGSVDNDGAVTGFSIIDGGNYKTLPTNPVSVTGGAGSGAVFTLQLQPTTKDYLTINRDSIDVNAWSRSNRWFHIDVIKNTAAYNDNDFVLDQSNLAIRPIIEFEPNIQLFNYGSVAKSPIDILDTIITSAYTQVENVSTPTWHTFVVNVGDQSVVLHHGDRVIFSNDIDVNVRNKIYDFKIVNISETSVPSYIGVITETGETFSAGNGVLVIKGGNTGNEFHYDGTTWLAGQKKTSANQAPRFDMFDNNDISFGDVNSYVNSSFNGTTIVEYKLGTGTNDVELGFPLSYRTFNNVGDIQFANSYDTDTFTYLVSPQTVTGSVNTGFLHITQDVDTFVHSNIWTNVVEKSKQYQVISHIADGVNNLFEIDILPNPSKTIPNIKVFLNNKFITVDNFGLTQIGVRYAVLINPTMLSAGDNIDILIYSDAVSKMGYYQVPPSLDNNAENVSFDSLTLGQIRNHLITLSQNSTNVVGLVPGSSNVRDLSIKQQGGSIIKHSASSIYGQMALTDDTLNLIDSIKLAQREYAKFKNKYLELASQLHIDNNADMSAIADTIIKQINGIKNISFPWYYSDMVPYGDYKKTLPPYTVLDPRIRSYELSTIFDDTVLSNKAVLVYLTRTANGVTTKRLLAKDSDFTFSKSNPSLTISDKFNLNYGDILTIVEYSDTDGNYVPETPTKLGLHPKYVPIKYVDDTYLVPTAVIQGHDGSITPAFNDYRDDLLLELELRIYNNIKISYQFAESTAYTPGKFRVTDYNLDEFNQVLTNNFLTWVGNNRLDYTTNSYFDENNAWTFNYKNFKDSINAEPLPGTWRAVFKWFYDTDRPHTHPWEMLGFSAEPDWWQDRYGPAPYTGGNLNLWSDLSIGYIHAGDRAGLDERYARPSLLQIIPVDDSGKLRSPDQFATINFNVAKANASFSIGNQGPVEAAWRRSSDYAFALQMAYALTKPGIYFGLLSEVSAYQRNAMVNQYLMISNNQHVTLNDVVLNGAVNNDGSIVRAAGYINWMVDYVTNTGVGQARDYLSGLLTSLSVKLSYKVAGFTDKNYLKVLAEQGSPSSTNDSIVIPDENYTIHLNKSVPIDRIVYSAVIVERTTNGYTVSGYALNNPYFTIVPSLANNNSYVIKNGKLSGTIYNDYQKSLVKIPYGYEFTTTQQVVDFLVGYQRYLQSQGFTFIDYDPVLNAKQDWVLSAQEFLSWAQQGWNPGNILVLSPVNGKLSVSTTDTVVDQIGGAFNSSKLLDPNFAIIKPSFYTVTRDANDFSVSTIKGQTICLAELNLVQYEHVMIFDNKTVFNDIIYSPDTGNRQYRLKFVGHKTADWTGAMNPPGFIYNSINVDEWNSGKDYRKGQLVTYKNIYYTALDNVLASDTFVQSHWQQINQSQIKTGLLSNFALNAQAFENIYDIDNPAANETLNFYSSGLTGFRERAYLTDLGIDVDTQAKFYQGYIKQKGTKNAITALAQAQLANINSEINVYEEWALRVGEYGATDSNKFVEVALDEAEITANPAAIQFVADQSLAEDGATFYTPIDYYKTSGTNATVLFKHYDPSSENIGLPVAGYVNVDDVDETIFDLANYRDLTGSISKIGTGYTIWTAKDFTGNWNVYRVSETEVTATSISYNLDNVASFTTSGTHGFVKGDVIALKNFSSTYDGFYQVHEVTGNQAFSVILANNYIALRDAGTIYGSGSFLKLSSSKIANPHLVEDITPKYGWVDGDKVWVDAIDAAGNWGVYNKTTPWDYNLKVQLNPSEYQVNSKFGSTVKTSPDGKFMYVGAPGSGRAAVFVKVNKTWVENSSFVDTTWVQNGSLTVQSTASSEFGAVVDINDRAFIISAPGSNSDQGYVFLYTVDFASGIAIAQVLVSPTPTASGRFGDSVATSNDGTWLYIGEPGGDKVYVYNWVTTAGASQTIPSGTTSTALTYPVAGASDILVSGSHPYVPNVDYTISGSNIVFTDTLIEKVVVTYHSHYQLYTTITEPSSLTGVRFGTSIKTNPTGSQLVIGASSYSNNRGAAYVYDRSIERFIASGTSNTFTPSNAFDSTMRVMINGIETTSYTTYGNNVYLASIPSGGTLIDIETNSFSLIQQLTGTTTISQYMGQAVDICKNTCSVYVSAPSYSTSSYSSGAVYRFVNQGKLYGTIIGSIKNPTVTVGHTIRINGIAVRFTGGSAIDNIVGSINSANIPGITATNYSGYLKIDSASAIALNKLDVLPGTGTAFADLGLAPLVQSQIITHPVGGSSEFFGTSLKISDDATTVAIGSLNASATEITDFDASKTIFDSGSTAFRDHIAYSGAVYMYDLMENPYESASNPAQMVYVQELIPAGLGSNFNFGSSIEFKNNFIYVGASADNETIDGGGSVFEFSNATATGGWDLIRYNAPRTDYESLSRAYIYDKKSQIILSRLEAYDPAKGKILGIADQDLDYKVEQDPAVYNNGFINYSPTYHWTNQQVGRTWWDLSQVRFIDYEQDTLVYKNKHWGATFPGSVFAVYEWVESSVLPSQYVANGGEGTPKYVDDSNYVTYTYVDPSTGIIKSNYYFWVSGKTTVDVVKTNRTNSVYTIQQILENPKDQGIPYISLISPNAVNVYNTNRYLTGTDTILHIDYSDKLDSKIIHSEYELLKEGAGDTTIPARIINKLQDSLAGMDMTGLMVPDPSLSDAEKYGIGIRPRQSMFVSRLDALKNFVKYANDVFTLHPIADQCNLDTMNSGEPYPVANVGEYNNAVDTSDEMQYIDTSTLPDGYLLLVKTDYQNDNLWVIYKWIAEDSEWMVSRIQSYSTSLYYSLADWYASDFDYTVSPTYTVNRYVDIKKLSLTSGDTIRVVDDVDGRFAYYRVTDTLALDRVGSQNGTIQLSGALYDLAEGNMGFDNDSFDTIRFDKTPSEETRYIFDAIHNDLLIKDLRVEFNNLFFALVNYIYSEQAAPDWIFKTSFISVLHRIRELAQYPSYIKDNQTFYESYINEVKPYRTTIREYVPSQSGIDYLHTGATDFDLPAYYDTLTSTYRSPSGELPSDANLLVTGDYIDWSNNYQYKVSGIQVANGGSGYTFTPNVSIVGGGGTGATAVADISSGSISGVFITNPGYGYTSTPTVLVNGNGTGAILTPVLNNEYFTSDPALSYNTPRNISTTIKFDRTEYQSDVVDWEPNTAYVATVETGIGNGNIWLASGTLVAFNNQVYLPVDANTTLESTFDGDLYQKLNDGNVLLTTNNRIMGYYQPTSGMPGKELTQLVSGIEYGGVKVDGNTYTGTEIDSTITSSYLDSGLGTRPEDINVDGGQYVDVYNSHAPEELIPGRVFDTLDMKVFTANTTSFDKNVYYVGRIVMNNIGYGYTEGDCNITAVDIPNSYLTPVLAANGAITSITIVSAGTSVDTANINPVITITGANIAPASATAFLTQSSYDLIGYRIFQDMSGVVQYSRIAQANTTELDQDLNLTDSNVYVTNANVLPEPSVELATPGVVFINGEKITYYTIDYTNNVLGQIRRAVDGTGAPAVHVAGSRVVDSSSEQVMGANVAIETWLNMTANVADGTGLAGSTSTEAEFLKSSLSYIP